MTEKRKVGRPPGVTKKPLRISVDIPVYDWLLKEFGVKGRSAAIGKAINEYFKLQAKGVISE